MLSAKRPNWRPPPRAPRGAPKARSRRTKHLSMGWMSHGDLVTPSRAHFSLPGDETRSGAQDLRRGLRHSARSNRPWSAPKDQGLSGTLASNGGEHRRLRRSAGTSALRAVRNASGEHLPDLRRTAIGWRGYADLYHNGDMLSALGVHVVNGWARAHP